MASEETRVLIRLVIQHELAERPPEEKTRVARDAGYTDQRLSDFLSGQVRIESVDIMRIADALGVGPRELKQRVLDLQRDSIVANVKAHARQRE